MNLTNRIKQKYINGTRAVLNESKKETKPYETNILGRTFRVLPNVFSPKYFHDTELFAEHLPIKEGDELLEIGPGTGAIAISSVYRGAKKVLSVDINPDAVKNTQENITRHNVGDRVEVRLGDVYEPLKIGEKFDVIFWNTPFGLVEEGAIPILERAVYDPGYKATERFIKQADKYLKSGGHLYIGFSKTMGDIELIKKFCSEVGRDLKTVFEAESVESVPVTFEIYEAVKS